MVLLLLPSSPPTRLFPLRVDLIRLLIRTISSEGLSYMSPHQNNIFRRLILQVSPFEQNPPRFDLTGLAIRRIFSEG